MQRILRTAAEDTLPLTIEHRRIYILPTPRGAAFLASLLLMLVTSINYSLSLGYALSFLLSGLFAACLLHTYRNLAGLVLASVDASPGFAGGSAAFLVTLDAPDERRRHGIEVATRSGAKGTLTTIDRCGRVTLEVPAATRGPLPLGRLSVRSDWPLGLWRTWSYVHAPIRANVFPAPEAEPPALPQCADTGDGQRRATDVQGDVAGLRDYTPGDPPSRIAWMRAARSDTLHVRLLDDRQGPARVTLGLQGTALHDTEARLSRLCAWVLQAAREGHDFSLELGTVRLDSAGGATQRYAALEALSMHGKTDTASASHERSAS